MNETLARILKAIITKQELLAQLQQDIDALSKEFDRIREEEEGR